MKEREVLTGNPIERNEPIDRAATDRVPLSAVRCPLFACYVSAGFPSPADDYIESMLDLNRELVKHPLATFFVRVEGDSMLDAGIKPNAVLIVDRAAETRSGDVVVARVGDELLVKELCIEDDGRIYLIPKNAFYKPLEITADLDFEIWGKVCYSINAH